MCREKDNQTTIKVKTPTEFGTKLYISLVEGHASTEKLSWNNYYEGDTLIYTVVKFKGQSGYYPLMVDADVAYRNRLNLQ